MLQAGKGTMRYVSVDPRDGGATRREKIAAFNYFSDWNWLIASAAFSDEFAQESAMVRNYSAFAMLLIIVLMGGLIYLAARTWITRPLRGAMDFTARLAGGDLTARLEADSDDEIGRLLRAIGDRTRTWWESCARSTAALKRCHGQPRSWLRRAGGAGLAAPGSRGHRSCSRGGRGYSSIAATAETAADVFASFPRQPGGTAKGNDSLAKVGLSWIRPASRCKRSPPPSLNSYTAPARSSMAHQVKEIAEQPICWR
jgi:HAMP domain-containing protein